MAHGARHALRGLWARLLMGHQIPRRPTDAPRTSLRTAHGTWDGPETHISSGFSPPPPKKKRLTPWQSTPANRLIASDFRGSWAPQGWVLTNCKLVTGGGQFVAVQYFCTVCLQASGC